MNRILSGIQPTSKIHIGNYFGAVKNWVKLQENYTCYFCVVDLHAITMPYDPKDLKNNTLEMYIALLACGINPQKAVLFIQSMVPEHTYLMWLLNCVTSYGELGRMTQFKDKSQFLLENSKDHFISAGLFNYPILQAADILIYKADFVPVGKDQEQHLELSRNIALRFNNLFGEYFPLPQPLFTETAKVMSLADPEKKMSKSLGEKHYIGLFDSEDTIVSKVKKAVTDTGGTSSHEMSPGVRNLFEIIKACGRNDLYDPLIHDFYAGNLMYKNLKEAVAEAVINLVRPISAERNRLYANLDYVYQLMREGQEKAQETASQTLKEVKLLLGLNI